MINNQIQGYGSFLYDNIEPSSSQRHKLFLKHNMRLMISPQYKDRNVLKSLCLHGFAIDNGAYICFQKNESFKEKPFLDICKQLGKAADFIVIPDVVANKDMTLYLAPYYIKKLTKLGFKDKLFIVWQDGMSAEDLIPYLIDKINIFVGGTTKAKLANLNWIVPLCKRFKVHCHVGRVNSYKRLELCRSLGADSFDGSGWSRFPTSFEILQDNKHLQRSLFKSNYSIQYTTLEDRCKALNISFKDILEFESKIWNVNTNGVGARKNSLKSDYRFLYWD